MNRFTMLTIRTARWCADVAGAILLGAATLLGLFFFGTGMAILSSPNKLIMELYPTQTSYVISLLGLRIVLPLVIIFLAGFGAYQQIVAARVTRAKRKACMSKQRDVAQGAYAAQIAGERRNRRFQ